MQDLRSLLKLCLVFGREIDTNGVDTNAVDTVPVSSPTTDCYCDYIINSCNQSGNYCAILSADDI